MLSTAQRGMVPFQLIREKRALPVSIKSQGVVDDLDRYKVTPPGQVCTTHRWATEITCAQPSRRFPLPNSIIREPQSIHSQPWWRAWLDKADWLHCLSLVKDAELRWKLQDVLLVDKTSPFQNPNATIASAERPKIWGQLFSSQVSLWHVQFAPAK